MSPAGESVCGPGLAVPSHRVTDVSAVQKSLGSQRSPGCFPEVEQNFWADHPFVPAGKGNCKGLWSLLHDSDGGE